MINSDNLSSKDLSKEKITNTTMSSSVPTENKSRETLQTRKQFKDVLQGKDDTVSEDPDEIETSKIKSAKNKSNHSSSVFELSAQQGEVKSKEKEGRTASLIKAQDPFNTYEKGPQNFLDKPEFAQEINDLTSITPNLAAMQQFHSKMLASSEEGIASVKNQTVLTELTPLFPKADLNTKVDNSTLEKHLANATFSSQDKSSSGNTNSEARSNLVVPANVSLALNQVSSNEAVKAPTPVSTIINQIVDQIYILQVSGKTDTVMTFQNMHPPILNGMQVTLTTFDTAKGEFNIAFSNLTQAGQNLIDSKLLQDPLKTELARLGVVIHMITTTTTIEKSTPSDTTFAGRREDNQSDDENPQKRKKK